MARSTETEPLPQDLGKMSKAQRLAALLIFLGPDAAVPFLKRLPEPELESVVTEMARIPFISQSLQRELLIEFTSVAIEASTSVLGGVRFTQDVLEKSVGLFRASDLLNRVSPDHTPPGALEGIGDMDPRQISHLLRHEQPQTLALVLSFLAPAKAALVFALLRPDVRPAVLERLATIAPTPAEVAEKVVGILNQKCSAKNIRPLNNTGGLKSTADLLNALDKNTAKSLLLHIEEQNPDLSQAIRQKMFSFEDLIALEPSTLQRVLRETDLNDLVLALKSASQSLKSKLLTCITKRAAETVQEEISFLGPVKLRDVEAAQARIIDVVRRLEAEGEIEIESAAPALQEVLV